MVTLDFISRSIKPIKFIIDCIKKMCISNRKGTYDLDYWGTFYDKRYKVYSLLETKDLKRLLSIKFAGYNVNLSYSWIAIFLSGVLGATLANIHPIVVWLASITMDEQQLDTIAGWIFGVDIVLPFIAWIFLYSMGLSLPKASLFYVLFFLIMALLQFFGGLISDYWYLFCIIALGIINIYSIVITVLDLRKQRAAIECAVVKDILLERESVVIETG